MSAPCQIAYYGLGLNTSIVLNAIGYTKSDQVDMTREDVYKRLRYNCIGNLMLSGAGLIPGYWATFLFIDRWSRKPIQIMGFTMLTIIFCAMGIGYDTLTKKGSHPSRAFIALFCLANFFMNFGLNTTTFIIRESPNQCTCCGRN